MTKGYLFLLDECEALVDATSWRNFSLLKLLLEAKVERLKLRHRHVI